jgi:hypothetical protein
MIKKVEFFDRESLDKFLIYHKESVVGLWEQGNNHYLVHLDEQDKKKDSHLISVLGSGIYGNELTRRLRRTK